MRRFFNSSAKATVQRRSLVSRAARLEWYNFYPILMEKMSNLSAPEKVVFESTLRRIKELWPVDFTDDQLRRSVVTQKMISIISSQKPNDRVVTMMFDLTSIFNELFVVDQTDDFIRFILRTNNPDELRCQEILKSPVTLRSFLNDIEVLKPYPERIGCVLEALLSALGKTMYQIDEQVKRNPLQALDANEQNLLNIMNQYDFQSFYQPYLRGTSGYFFDVSQSVDSSTSSVLDRVAPDLVALKSLQGEPLIKPCQGLYFRSESTGWMGHAIRGGIPLQYGPSGTTGASLTAICLLMRSKGELHFARQSIEETMPLIVHSLMHPYLMSGYHSVVEVMVAALCYINLAQKQFIVIPSPLSCQKEAFHFVLQSTASSPDQGVVEKLSHALNVYYEFCSTQLRLECEDDGEKKPRSQP